MRVMRAICDTRITTLRAESALDITEYTRLCAQYHYQNSSQALFHIITILTYIEHHHEYCLRHFIIIISYISSTRARVISITGETMRVML